MITSILRHGTAGLAATDSHRKLTPGGIDDISFGSRQFAQTSKFRDLPVPTLILHSAWLRTTQTAEILAAAFPGVEIRPDSALLPGGTVAGVTETLYQLQQNREQEIPHVVLVSHQPLVSELVDFYLDCPASVPGLPPGGLVCIDMDTPGRGCGALLYWAMPPEYEAVI